MCSTECHSSLFNDDKFVCDHGVDGGMCSTECHSSLFNDDKFVCDQRP